MIVEKIKFITRQYVRDNRHKLFLFGDNTVGKGFGGQAKEMRGEPNTFGIPTKWIPSRNKQAYFKDKDFFLVSSAYDELFKKIKSMNYQIIVIPEDGIGTGLARLDKTAPKIFEHLQKQLNNLTQ